MICYLCMRILILVLTLFIFTAEAGADTVYLKNGRNIEGIVKKQDQETIELDVGFGTVKFRKSEILSIEKAGSEKAKSIRREWEIQKKTEAEKWRRAERAKEEARRRKELEPKEVGFSKESDRIVVDTLLNKKVTASLLLDTGASSIVLSEKIARKLNIRTNTARKDMVEVQVADGRKIDAVYTILESVSVQGAEAKEVPAVVLLDAEESIEDGLLGMSFLKRFNFQIDAISGKLILQKRE